MNLSQAVQAVLNGYTDFSGRARRSEYWCWTLAMLIVYAVFLVLLAIASGFVFLMGLFYLAVLLPSIAVGIRRLHDTDRSGWWLLLAFLPLVGAIILVVFFATAGTPGPNRYGADPKAPSPTTA